MLTTKMVCRLMDAQGQLLGWTEHMAAVRGDGMIRAATDILVVIDTAGAIVFLSWHWPDVNVETRVAMAPVAVEVRHIVPIAKANDPLIVCGVIPQSLPAVTVRTPVAVEIPVGQMGALG